MATGEPGGQRQGPARDAPGSSGIGSVPSGAERCPVPPLCLRGLRVPGPDGGRAGAVAALGAGCRLPGAQHRPRCARRGSSASAPRPSAVRARRLPLGCGGPEPDGPGRAPGGSAGGPRPRRASAESPAPLRAAGGAQSSGMLMRAHSSLHV
ncbi:unnamed protein product [Coccothraustes coccothraustes]